MAKRFIETTVWTQNKWFRKLSPKYKLFWFYLICNCDSVGVWEEDLELASFIIGEEYSRDDISISFGEKIKWFNGKKLWITDFCHFQYGELIEENKLNKPHQSYIALLKNHSLWIDYTKTIQRDKDKEKEKDMDIEIDREGFNKFWNIYDKKVGDKEKLLAKWSKIKDDDKRMIFETLPKYVASTEKQFRKNPESYLNNKSWNDEIITKEQQQFLEQPKPKGAMI